MQKELANLLRQRLDDVPFKDVLAGIVQPVIDSKYADDTSLKIQRKMPVSYDVAGPKNTYMGMERQLIPDDGKKSLIYFEDFGITADTSARVSTRHQGYISNMRCVCWLNKKKLINYKYNELTAHAINEIRKRLVSGTAINSNGFIRLFLTVSRIPIQDANIFSRYNYAEDELQYLRPPAEYFAIDFQATFVVNPNCLPYVNLNA